MARNIFNETMSSFKGAADLVMGFEQYARERRGNEIQMSAQLQQMEFQREIQPLRMRLMKEQVAAGNLQNFARGVGLYHEAQQLSREGATDMAALKAFDDIGKDFSVWKGVKADNAGSGNVDFSGLFEDPAGGPTPGVDLQVDPNQMLKGGSATGGGLIPDTMSDPTIPFTPDDPVTEGTGDGSGAGTLPPIAERQLAHMKPVSIADREIAAQAARQKAGVVAADPVADELAARKAKLAAEDVMPPSVTMLERLKLNVQAFGGLQGIAKRQPQLVPRLTEMLTTLAADPQAAKWKVAQVNKVKRSAAREAVIGKVTSAGLPVSKFADVLGAIEAGLPVDPATLDKRIESVYKMEEEEAKNKALKADSLTGYLADPALAPLARAGLSVFSRAEKSKREGMSGAMSDFLQRGDVEGARGLVRQAALDLAPTAIQNKYVGVTGMLSAVNDVKGALDEFYNQYGKDATGPWKGRQISEITGDTRIQGLRTRLAVARMAYVTALSGAAFPEQELKRYETMFPSEKKTAAQNSEQADQLISALGVQKQGAEQVIYGDIAPVLSGQIIPDGLTPAAKPTSFNSTQEADAAIGSGKLPEGATYYVGTRFFTVRRTTTK